MKKLIYRNRILQEVTTGAYFCDIINSTTGQGNVFIRCCLLHDTTAEYNHILACLLLLYMHITVSNAKTICQTEIILNNPFKLPFRL